MRSHDISHSNQLRGAFTALVTPFRDGEIDDVALRQLVDFQIDSGINGLVPCGTTGESATLTDAEQKRVISIIVEQTSGRVPVIAGTGCNSTAATITRTRHARQTGANAALVVVPYYNKPSATGLIQHYTAIAESTDLPLILYNVPGRTGINMNVDTVLRLAELPMVTGIKEASGNVDQVSEIIASAPADFVVLSGDDSLTLPIISVGGTGVISVVSNIVPGSVAALCEHALSDDVTTARRLHAQLFPLSRAMFLENNPSAVKSAMAMLGLCRGELRPPLSPLSPENENHLLAVMRKFGLPMEQSIAAA